MRDRAVSIRHALRRPLAQSGCGPLAREAGGTWPRAAPPRRHTRSASRRRSSFLRSLGSSSFLRSRIAFGVTSTSSSSPM